METKNNIKGYMETKNNIKGFCFVSDERFNRIAQWAKNSFEYNNPGIEFVILDMQEDKYKDYDFYKWHIKTQDHPFRKDNPYGFLKYLAALEFMEKEQVDTLILLGADVITVSSFNQALQEVDYDILTSTDIGHISPLLLNPDVQVIFGKKFLEKCRQVYMDQIENYTLRNYSLEIYQEMGIMNFICNENIVKHKPLYEVYNTSPECFNENVRSNIHSFFDNNDQKIKTINGEYDIITIHIQHGLGSFNDVDEFNNKLNMSMNKYSIFHDDSVKQFIEKITKDKIWA